VQSNGQQRLASPGIHAAYRLIADHLYGELGRFAYAAWGHINGTYFGGALPETFILWDLTDYGRCLGWCRSAEDGPPIIKLHPNLVMPSDREAARAQLARWGIPVETFGPCFAFDVLLHECMHANVEYNLGGWRRLDGAQRSKWTSHNNPLWVAECNRIAGLLGFRPCYTMKKYKRVGGKVKYTCDGPDFECFPYTLPGRKEFYLARSLPFDEGSVVRSWIQRAAGASESG
jgi:hypothetical protein